MPMQALETIQAGWEAPAFRLPDTQGREYSLEDFKDKKGLLVVFTCNHCPYAKAAWPLLIELYKKHRGEVEFVGVNPNDEAAYPEDSLEVMKQKVGEWGIPFPYLRDESQEVARAYQAQCTPDSYLFKNENNVFKLFYRGRINDNWQDPENVREHNLDEALTALEKNESPPLSQPPSMGCSIKWKRRE